MWENQVSIDIEVPAGRVYDRLLEFERHSDFSEGLVRVERAGPGPMGVGTRFRAEERVPGRYTSWCEITGLDAPRRIAWRAWVEGVMRTEWEFGLSPVAGGTRVTLSSRWEPAGPAGFLMLHLHRRRHAPRENARTLARIKAVLEAEASTRTRKVPA